MSVMIAGHRSTPQARESRSDDRQSRIARLASLPLAPWINVSPLAARIIVAVGPDQGLE